MSENTLSFGLLFQEPAVDAEELPVPVYDEAKDISVLEQDGELVPFLTAAPGAMATQTEIKARGESQQTRTSTQPPHAGLRELCFPFAGPSNVPNDCRRSGGIGHGRWGDRAVDTMDELRPRT